ncbi:MAG: hypothetical protein JNL11_04130 [Bdellovibrionaceae bacterium]|nr:hypothetical protein [Pseudobdellovibrionaceae bacterium]
MKNGYSQLIQSKYFVTDFNSAIFDGPIRIYFTQVQESLALKIYFHIQNHFVNEVKKLKDISSQVPSSLFILIYPNPESYEKCFETAQPMSVVNWESDLVIGINENVGGVDFALFDVQFKTAYGQWLEQNQKTRHDEFSL